MLDCDWSSDVCSSDLFNAVAQGRISLTPLQLDLTHYNQLGVVKEWLTA
jgi:broad specificity polyphosphatase/5'/3'-nucleotidase SurE